MRQIGLSGRPGRFPAFAFTAAFGLLLAAMPARAAFPYVKRVAHTSTYLTTQGMGDYLVYLPPGYETSGLRYSTVFYLHGSTDNMYTDTCQAKILDGLIASKSVNPMIVVYLNVTSTGGYRDNGPGDMEESFIFKDLIPHIDSAYRTIGTAKGRAIDGFSMGAAGSLRLGFTYPKDFGAVMSWDGGATSSAIATLVEQNIADIKGKIQVKLYSRPTTDPAVVSETLKKLGVDYTHTIVNTDHVGVLGESGPTNQRKCNDPSRITAGWTFLSGALAAPANPVSIRNARTGERVEFDRARLGDLNFYTPAGKFLGEVRSRGQLPGKGVYLVQDRKNPGRRNLAYID